MKAEYGLDLPRRLQIEFSRRIQHVAEDSGTEISPEVMWAEFESAYLLPSSQGVELRSAEVTTTDEGAKIVAQLLVDGQARTVSGAGGGPIAAFMQALAADEVIGAVVVGLDVVDYAEHAVAVGGISAGSDATAVAFVETKAADGTVHWGVGLHESILTASLRAVISALNRFSSVEE